MTTKINMVEETDEGLSEENKRILKLSELPWREYLADKNYGRDINTMCEECVAKQIKEHGKRVIPCKGLANAKSMLGEEVYDNLTSTYTEEEVELLNAIYDPYAYMEAYLDSEKKGRPDRRFIRRWYQERVIRCTAQSKVVRMGRRTGKTMALAILILHKVLTNTNYRVLLVSPFAVQTEEVVDNIKNLCTLLPENPLVSSKASPNHVLTFNTGSVLKGFTASTDANSVRGQPGHLLVLDEIDDIPEKAMISIMGIKMDNPNVEIWRSGTPKGEMNLHKAEQDITSKSFHYPSFVIPHYDDKLDKELREELGEIGFVQETMAEFGLVSNGVFQTMFLQKAQQRSQFITVEDVFKDRNRYILIIGVDWNHDQVGTRIVVIAYDKLNPQFKVIEKEAVSQVGYTQQAAMEKIIHLNRKYNVDHIFCDEGFGATQIGDLKRVGEAAVGVLPKGHPDLKLLDVQAVNFSSNTEFKDPISGDIYKTPTKQFAVQNTVVMLERDLLSLHPKEDNDIILQMKNYIEKSRNKGKIVYSYISKKIGDHDLDALMIGLYGYRKIYSTLFEGSVFQAMIKFANKADPNMDGSGAIESFSEDILPHVQIKFSKAPKHFSSRTSKMGGLNSRNRSSFR